MGPNAWFEADGSVWRAKRRYTALELNAAVSDRFQILSGESGFIFRRTDQGGEGWSPDHVLTFAHKA